MNEFVEKVFGVMCPRCQETQERTCCRNFQKDHPIIMDEKTGFMFGITDNGECAKLGKTGCVLQGNWRPSVCRHYPLTVHKDLVFFAPCMAGVALEALWLFGQQDVREWVIECIVEMREVIKKNPKYATMLWKDEYFDPGFHIVVVGTISGGV